VCHPSYFCGSSADPARILGLTTKSSWVEALIKGEYAVRGVRQLLLWRARMRSACAKRVETKEKVIVRGMEFECKKR
jgi:hypothetical protein